MVDTPTGEHNIGPATVDTDHDGKPDTAVVTDANGDTIMYTDTHHDGQADVRPGDHPKGKVVDRRPHRTAAPWTQDRSGIIDQNGNTSRTRWARSGAFDPHVGGATTRAPAASA